MGVLKFVTVKPVSYAPLSYANLYLMREIVAPFNNKSPKIDLYLMRTSILCENFRLPSFA